MTAVKRKPAEDRIKGSFFETFYVQETPDALIITEPPNPFIGALVTIIFGLPMLGVIGVLVVFAVREGGAALVAAVMFIPVLLLLVASMVLYGVNTRTVTITRETISIRTHPISFGQQQISLEGLKGFEIVTYRGNRGGIWHRLNIIPSSLYQEALFNSQSAQALNTLQMRIEGFLGV